VSKSNIVAIIPAAGRGSRLAPFPCPKELFPVGYQKINIKGEIQNRPKVVSQYLVEDLAKAGAQRIFFILGEGKSDIMRYYGDGQRFGTNISYLYQEELRGMPNAIDLFRPWADDVTVLFGMPDTIVEPHNSYQQLLAFHNAEKADLTLGLFRTNNPTKFGMVDIDESNNVTYTIDKPLKSNLQYMWGTACWSQGFTKLLGEFLSKASFNGNETVLGDVFNYALEKKLTVKGLVFENGKYIDIGTTDELNQALKQFHL